MITPAERVAEALRTLVIGLLPDGPDMRPSELDALDERREDVVRERSMQRPERLPSP